MRIVFSRKGFDSEYGGGVSPVLPDGTMLSIPIPEAGSGITYATLQTPRGSLLTLMDELGTRRYREDKAWHALDEQSEAHLDPDIYPGARTRDRLWRAVFGQCDRAQSVLENRGVTKGDLFIFYGTFRKTVETAERLQYRDKPFHAIFGYMSVGEVVSVNGTTNLPWCAEHPHLVNRDRRKNTLYLAADYLALNGSRIAGAGSLLFDQRRLLSSTTEHLSRWRLPSCFHPEVSGKAMSNHLAKDWTITDEGAFLQTKSPGQEYVVEATDEMLKWAASILATPTA